MIWLPVMTLIQVQAADKGTLDKALQVVSKAGKKRKRVCREAVLELECATEMTKDHLIGAIGIDEDGYYDQLFDDGEV
jgi:predicted methyltransferase MtxX (methanogen marker protein 4)